MSTHEQLETIADPQLADVTGGKSTDKQVQAMLTSLGDSIKDVANSRNSSSSDQLMPMMMMMMMGGSGGGSAAAAAPPPPPPPPSTVVKVNVGR